MEKNKFHQSFIITIFDILSLFLLFTYLGKTLLTAVAVNANDQNYSYNQISHGQLKSN